MPLSQADIELLANRLDAAEKSRTQIDQFSLEFPIMTLEDGYEVQRAWVKIKLSEGRKILGHKIGLTSRAMQRSSNIDEPDYGVLLDDMLFANNSDIPVARFIEARVEVELAFVLKDKLIGPNITIEDVLNATDYVAPAIEIIDARIKRIDPTTKATRRVQDTISDNAANAGIVMGDMKFNPREIDLKWIPALISKNGIIEDSGVAGAVLGHPATGIAWLANKLAPWGEFVDAGEVLLCGSFTAPLFAGKNDEFEVDYGPMGKINVRFA